MKYILFLSLFAATAAFADVPVASDYKYQTHFTKYSCKSFREEAPAPAIFTDSNIAFKYLSVDQNMKNALLTLTTTDGSACEYRAHYSIDAKADILNFVDSAVVGDEACIAKKDELDSVFKEGFRYVQKYYYYFALKFSAKFSNACEASTGNFLVEFEMGKE